MKVRRALGLLLCAALCLGCLTPALAQEASSDQALAAVTGKVKAALGLDTEVYTDFQGWAEEDVLLGKRWSLTWDGDGVDLNITADDNGKVYSYYRYESAVSGDAESWYFGGRFNIPRLPEDKSGQAYAVAKEFLGRVLETGLETVELEDTYSPSLYQNSYRYTGTIRLNGLPSPVTCSVTVRASDLAVTRFWRSDESAGYLNGVPKAANNVSEAQARRTLQGTLALEAKFVLTEDGKTAVVRYVPTPIDDYYVDGETGKLVNLTELYDQMWRSGGAKYMMNMAQTAEMAADGGCAGSSGLTQAEQAGAAILNGVLSKEDLDRAVQNSWPEMGLETYSLASASYSVEEKEGDDYDVTCRLTYGKQEGQVLRNKYVTVDGKTGAVQSLVSRRYYQGEGEETLRYATGLAAAQSKADGVLKSFAGAHYASLGLKESTDGEKEKSWEHIFSYQQKAGEWFYEGNSYTVGVDATDGTLSRLSGSFDEEVELVVPEKIVTPGEAAEAYAGAMAMPFGYLEVPVSVSLAGGGLMPLLKEAGYSYVTALKTGYTLEQPEDASLEGVDAVTGEVVLSPAGSQKSPLAYDDLDGHWVQTAAEELAVYGIGLEGGSLKPGETLTQLDMVALLVSVDGWRYDPATATSDETDRLYERAYSLGLVTPQTRDEDRAVTRGELVRLILNAAGYERLAGLTGIFRCSFADSGDIAEGDLGYAALAQGFGLVKGGSDGAYAGARTATRAEGIAMLYQYMK